MIFKHWKIERVLPWILVVGGVIGVTCSFIITQDKFKLLENPHFVPSCDLNPIISCGSVMSSKQGAVFGFPNPFIGLAAFAVLVTIGMAIFAGAKFKRWFWIGLQIGSLFGIAFVHWLFFESVYRIHALCPYCMVVWAVVITTFWYTLQYNLKTGIIKMPSRLVGVGSFIRKHHLDLYILWLLVITALILRQFWYYFGPAIFGN